MLVRLMIYTSGISLVLCTPTFKNLESKQRGQKSRFYWVQKHLDVDGHVIRRRQMGFAKDKSEISGRRRV